MTHMRDDAEKQQMEIWGVPDWRASINYPTSKDGLIRVQWCWEFLRRNADYRQDWLTVTAPPAIQDSPPKGLFRSIPITKESIARRYHLLELTNPCFDWKKLPAGFGFRLIEAEAGNVVDPIRFRHQWAKPLNEWDSEMAQDAEMQRHKPSSAPSYNNLRVHVEFDLGESLLPQLAKAKKHLAEEQREAKALMDTMFGTDNDQYSEDDYMPVAVPLRTARQPNKTLKNGGSENQKAKDQIDAFPLLLRLYDAHNCGRNHEEITNKIVELQSIENSTFDRRINRLPSQWKRLLQHKA